MAEPNPNRRNAPPARSQDSNPVLGVLFRLADTEATGVGLEVGLAVGLAFGVLLAFGSEVGVGVTLAGEQTQLAAAGQLFNRQTPT